MTRKISSQYYAIFFVLYTIILCILNNMIFGEFIPSGTKGLWILASFAPLMAAELLVRTIASAPYDSAANSVVALATLLQLGGNEQISTTIDSILKAISFALFLIFSFSLSVIWLERMRRRERLKNSISVFTSQLGNSKAIFTVIHFFILYALHISADKVFILAFTWIVIVFGRPLERIVDSFYRVYEINRGLRRQSNVIGDIVSRSHPSLLTIKVDKDEHPEINSLVLVRTSKSLSQMGIVLDNYRLADELWSNALILKDEIPNSSLVNVTGPMNVALSCSDDMGKQLFGDDCIKAFCRVIGSVIEKSQVSQIQIELYRDHLGLSEGHILGVRVGSQDVMYQVTNGTTESEELQKSNRHGYMRVSAVKIGHWDAKEKVLEQVSWTPTIYSPVYKEPTIEKRFCKDFIGFLPGTELGIKANYKELVSHNTAILGVLGSGKTTLALELIQRMAADEIKVWIIDITEEYGSKLRGLVNGSIQESSVSEINEAIKGLEHPPNKNKEYGGNHRQFAEHILTKIREFMEKDSFNVRVFNPNDFTVLEQTSNPFNNEAGLGELSPAQITRIVAEQALNYMKSENPDKRRLCLVLEEAHSLVPEWNSVSKEGDINATNGTAKAIMQGRKYGFGCLLITQRTANVTKSILNQCNTMFALQIFDDTGKGFLQNYFGVEFASMLPALPKFHSLAFGHGLNVKTPVLFELNNPEDFQQSFASPKTSVPPDDT